MNDIFKDMQAKVGCEYISDLPSYKRKVWQEMKRLNPADYEERQLSQNYGKKIRRLRTILQIILPVLRTMILHIYCFQTGQ